MVDWCTLPDELLCGIALKMDSLEDFIYFSAVCHLWNNISCMVKWEWNAAKPTTPFLLLAEPDKGSCSTTTNTNLEFDPNECHHRKILSITANKCYELKIPETFGARCWGSSCGWVVMVHLNTKAELFNPITRARLSLPPTCLLPASVIARGYHPYRHELTDVDDGPSNFNCVDDGPSNFNCVDDCDDECDDDNSDDNDIDRGNFNPDDDNEWIMKKFIRRFIVLKMPRKDKSDEFVWLVMAIHWNKDELVYARPGDKFWSRIITTCKMQRQVRDVICWKGLVLILYYDGSLAYCDVDVGAPPVTSYPLKHAKANEYLHAPCQISEFVVTGFGKSYMVELGGDLIVVSRYKKEVKDENDKPSYRTEYFKVYTLDYNTKLWEEVKDLGDYLLFVGNNTAMSVYISKARDCLRNATYFTDDEIEFWHGDTGIKTRGHDMGVFDMTSREFIPFYEGADALGKYSSPEWFIPKF